MQQQFNEQLNNKKEDANQLVSNTTVILNQIEEEIKCNDIHMNLMEQFIENKYGQLADLQHHILLEFKQIQSYKIRNKKIQKIIVTSFFPILKQIRIQLDQIKQELPFLCSTVTNYIQQLHQKAQLLIKKQSQEVSRLSLEKIELKTQVQALKLQSQRFSKLNSELINQIANLRQENSRKNNNSAIKNQVMHLKQSIKQGYKNEENTLLHVQQFQLTDKSKDPNNCLHLNSQLSLKTKMDREKKQISNSEKPNITKYQQYYNILQAKKFNLQYRCEKVNCSPKKTYFNKSNSKSPTKIIEGNKNKQNSINQRKDHIRQKIQKIKIKAEKKQCNNLTPNISYKNKQ